MAKSKVYKQNDGSKVSFEFGPNGKLIGIKKNGKSKSDRDTFIFKISRSKEEEDEFAFNYNPLNNFI